MNPTPKSVAAIATLALLTSAALLSAGPLNPPAGPVAPSYKTLGEVEPRIAVSATSTPGDADSLFKITQPGSYYLTANITGVSGKHGIEIAQVAVTLDLNGFTMFGAPGTLDGIHVSGVTPPDIVVRNGTLQSWRNDGVDASNAYNSKISGISVTLCVQAGIKVGNAAVVTDCSVSLCATGFSAGDECVFERCIATQSLSGDGFDVGSFGSLAKCVSSRGAGIGFDVGGSGSIRACVANENAGSGFSTGESVIVECLAQANGVHGFSDVASTIDRSDSRANSANGFDLTSSVIRGCKATENTQNGILARNTCTVARNTCYTNGSGGIGAGIRVEQTRNRVEDNVCTNNDIGIDCVGLDTFLARNLCKDNTTNWNIAAGNVCLVVQATETIAAIVGNAGGLSPGSSSPFANFTY